jgi:hypothetical protein
LVLKHLKDEELGAINLIQQAKCQFNRKKLTRQGPPLFLQKLFINHQSNNGITDAASDNNGQVSKTLD